MKSQADLSRILFTKFPDEENYYDRVMWPLFNSLSFPNTLEARRRRFPPHGMQTQ